MTENTILGMPLNGPGSILEWGLWILFFALLSVLMWQWYQRFLSEKPDSYETDMRNRRREYYRHALSKKDGDCSGKNKEYGPHNQQNG